MAELLGKQLRRGLHVIASATDIGFQPEVKALLPARSCPGDGILKRFRSAMDRPCERPCSGPRRLSGSDSVHRQDFVIVDFEGNSATIGAPPKRSPMGDIAGMLRSFRTRHTLLPQPRRSRHDQAGPTGYRGDVRAT
jgi:hypothetical protein